MGDLLAGALRSLATQRLRSFVAALGIFWGVAMLSFLSAVMDGYDAHYHRALRKIGPGIVVLYAGTELKDGVGSRGARPIHFDPSDPRDLVRLTVVRRAGANQSLGERVFRSGRYTRLVRTIGVGAETLVVRNFSAARGRLLSELDVRRAARVVFLGARAAERLWGPGAAVGRQVRIDGLPFEVVGVSAPKGDLIVEADGRDDDLAFIPLSTAERWLLRNHDLTQLVFEPVRPQDSWHAVGLVRALLSLRHHFDPESDTAVGYFNIREALEIVTGLGRALRFFLFVSGLITLAVGAVGVTNVMMVIASERRSEIGLRKAVGATNRRIFAEMFCEALLLTTAAGVSGLAAGAAAAAALAAAADQADSYLSKPVIEPWSLAAMTLIVVAVGIAAAVLPATRAARADPAASMRQL